VDQVIEIKPTETDPLTGGIIGAALTVHKELGPGLLESAYQACLAEELRSQSINFRREVPVPLVYKGIQLDCGYRLDFLVEEQVIVECKAVESLAPIHDAQVLTYLRLTGKHRALILNFNCKQLRNGIKRLVL
jgi:GxxExxY protein